MPVTWRGAAAAAVALVLAGAVWCDAWGQAPKQGEPKPGQTAVEKPPIPSNKQLAVLIQTAVVALSQANVTGNYTVLHAMAAPDFQKTNRPEKLAQTFASVRKIDLTPVIIFSPVLAKQPAIDDKNILRLTGHYETAPQRVLFDLLFQPVAGHWRLFGISIATQIVHPPAPTAAAPPPEEKAPPADKKKAPAATK